VRVPLLDKAQAILKKYKDHPKAISRGSLLPIFSNQKTNEYLKEIAKASKVKKKLTFHTARHTFATTVTLANGVPIETVSKLLGHNKIATTQIYARVIDSKISSDMEKLRHTLNNVGESRKSV
jgi:site-specific recombinase XerD